MFIIILDMVAVLFAYTDLTTQLLQSNNNDDVLYLLLLFYYHVYIESV